MKAAILCIIGLLGATAHAAAALVEGHVRLPSGAPVPGAQVLLFDLSDLRAAPLTTTTDGSGHFTLPTGTIQAPRVALEVDFVEVPVIGLGELSHQGGFAHLTGPADDQRLSLWSGQPLGQSAFSRPVHDE